MKQNGYLDEVTVFVTSSTWTKKSLRLFFYHVACPLLLILFDIPRALLPIFISFLRSFNDPMVSVWMNLFKVKIITFSKVYMGSPFSGCSSTSKGLLRRGFEKTDSIRHNFLIKVWFIMQTNGQSLLTWIHIIKQHWNARQNKLFKRTDLIHALNLAVQRKLALFIQTVSHSFTNLLKHIQPIITNTHVCLITLSTVYHSKSLTQINEDK